MNNNKLYTNILLRRNGLKKNNVQGERVPSPESRNERELNSLSKSLDLKKGDFKTLIKSQRDQYNREQFTSVPDYLRLSTQPQLTHQYTLPSDKRAAEKLIDD